MHVELRFVYLLIHRLGNNNINIAYHRSTQQLCLQTKNETTATTVVCPHKWLENTAIVDMRPLLLLSVLLFSYLVIPTSAVNNMHSFKCARLCVCVVRQWRGGQREGHVKKVQMGKSAKCGHCGHCTWYSTCILCCCFFFFLVSVSRARLLVKSRAQCRLPRCGQFFFFAY